MCRPHGLVIVDIAFTELRSWLRHVLRRVEARSHVRVSRRGRVVAVIHPPDSTEDDVSLADFVDEWRADHVAGRGEPDDGDPWADVRDPSPGPDPVVW